MQARKIYIFLFIFLYKKQKMGVQENISFIQTFHVKTSKTHKT